MMDLHTLVASAEIYMCHRLDLYLKELRELCAIDSGTDYKPGLDEMARYLAARMRDLGMKVTITESDTWGNDVLGTLYGDGCGTIVLLGHMDTVYPPGTATARPWRVENKAVYAPGVSDMKGGILSALYAIEAMLSAGYLAFGEVRFLCVSDEETSRRHSENLIYQVCQDSDAVLVLEAARANGDIVSARKGTAWYTLTAHGHSAHAGVEPEKGKNAIIELAHQILQFSRLNGWLKELSICPGVISGGTVPNVVPDYAQARIDLRYLYPSDRNAVERRWRELMQQQYVPEVALTLELEGYRDPMACTREGLQLAEMAQEIAGMLGFSLNHVLSGGSSDGRYATPLGVPVLDGLGPVGGLDHSPDEYLMIESVAPRTALMAGLIAAASNRTVNLGCQNAAGEPRR